MSRKLFDPPVWRRHTFIDIGGKPVLCSEVEADWERADNLAMDNGARIAMGLKPKPGHPTWQRVYLQRGRSGNKTTAAIIRGVGMVAGADHKIKIVWASGSREQAAIGIDVADSIFRLNPHHHGLYEVQRNVILNPKTGSELSIISADEKLAFGLTLDALFLDELANWPEQHHGFFETLYSGIDKKPNSYLQIGTNAGYIGSVWWNIYQTICNSADWYKGITTEEQTYLSAEGRARQKEMLFTSQYDRVHRNIWTQSVNESLPDFMQCINPTLTPQMTPQPGAAYTMAVDVGAEHDRAAISVVQADDIERKIRLVWCKSWKAPVDLVNLWNTVRALHARFHPVSTLVDPWESRTAQQQLMRLGVRLTLFPFTSPNHAKMAVAMTTAITSGQLELYPDEELISDMHRVSIVERNGVLKVTADRTSRGHCDKFFTLAMCTVSAQEILDQGFSGDVEQLAPTVRESPSFVNRSALEYQSRGVLLANRMHLRDSIQFNRNGSPYSN